MLSIQSDKRGIMSGFKLHGPHGTRMVLKNARIGVAAGEGKQLDRQGKCSV
jgi:hypothetical protein